MKLYLKIYFYLYAFICQEIRKNSVFQDRGGSICNLNICLLADLTLLTGSVADGQQAAPEVRLWFKAQMWALTESIRAFPNAFFLPCLSTVQQQETTKSLLVLLRAHSSKLGISKRILKWFISREEIRKRKKVRISLSPGNLYPC